MLSKIKTQKVKRYNSIAIILHWLMAVGFFMMFFSGITMSYFEVEKSLQFNLYQWHKSGGIILLIAFCLRLLVKIITITPPLPEKFNKLEIIAAKLGHYSLYLLMFAMPITGWLIVSSSVYGLPTIVFGWFEWPHIPNMEGNKEVHEAAELAHFIIAILFGLTIIIHILAVIKHYIKDDVNLLKRMWWV